MGPKPPAKGARSKTKQPSSKPSKSGKPAYKPRKRDEVKTKRSKPTTDPRKKKARQYTEKELNIQKLNMITPAGVQKAKGKKKDKVFVDDQESMMTILAMVNASKEGQIESKMMRARQMEEIREARQQELEKRQADKRGKLEDTKNSLRKQRKRKPESDVAGISVADSNTAADLKSGPPKQRKKVSFG